MSEFTIRSAKPGKNTSNNRQKIPALTGIRGIAACWVVCYHFCAMAARLPALTHMLHIPILDRGYLGVDLFFILSGFVLALTYDGAAQPLTLAGARRFLIGRVFRIFPLHWCVLLCFLLAVPFMGKGWPTPDLHLEKNFILSVLLVQSWAHLPLIWNAPAWSLSDELLAYIAFPVMMSVTSRVTPRWLALTLAASAFAAIGGVCASTRLVGLDHTQGLGIIRCLLEFPAGMLLWRMLQLQPLTARCADWSLVGGVVLFVVALFSESLDVLALPAFSLLILSCASNGALPKAIFGNTIVRFLGEISFSIYLVHALFLEVGARVADVYAPGSIPARLSILAIAVVAIFPVAYLTWRFIELKGQALGRAVLTKSRPVLAAGRPLAN